MSDPDYGQPLTPPAQPMRPGDYAKQFPRDTPEERAFARDVMRRQGCRSIRFELHGALLIAHGYVGRFESQNVEDL